MRAGGVLLVVAACGRLNFDEGGGTATTIGLAVGTGEAHACGIVDGALYCWGANVDGQIGQGSTSARETSPLRVGTDDDWTAVTAGFAHSCGLRGRGQVYCWGANDAGQLGLGDTTPRTEPTLVALEVPADQLHSRNAHTCVVLADKTLACWGANFEGQCGVGAPIDDQLAPIVVDFGEPIGHMRTGQGHTVVTSNGRLFGTGRNSMDQLGLGDLASDQFRNLELIDAGPAWERVAGGQSSSCAIRSTTLACWGANGMGQLGVGDLVSRSTPALANNERRWLDVDTNVFHACAIANPGILACWGRNVEGQLGDNSGTDYLTPMAVDPFEDWIAVATGRFYTCGARGDGTLWCTGANDDGQLGSGDLDRRFEWTQLALP